MKLSILIPVYNEEKTLLSIIKKVKDVNLEKIKKEIIIVDDFSKDGTKKLLKQIQDNKIRIFFHSKNKGKGAAIRTALKHATGDFVINQDADLEYDPREYLKLIEVMKKNSAKVVYGSRIKNKKNKYAYLSYYLGNLFLNSFLNMIYSSNLTDFETCYKLIDRRLLQSLDLRANKFDIEPEITSKILRKGIKIYEVPIDYTPRKKEQGKKIGWKDGISALWAIIKYRFS